MMLRKLDSRRQNVQYKGCYYNTVSVGCVGGVVIYFYGMEERQIEKITVDDASISQINSFASNTLTQLVVENDSSENLCIFHLPIIQCMISSDRHKELRTAYNLPGSQEERTKLFSGIEDLLDNYSTNWQGGSLESVTYLSEKESEEEDNLFSTSSRTRVKKLGTDAFEKISKEFFDKPFKAPVNDSGVLIVEEVYSVLTANFTATWKKEFEKPEPGKFTLSDGKEIDCKYMWRESDVRTSVTPERTTVYLQFKGAGMGMLLVMPSSYDGLTELAKTMQNENWMNSLKDLFPTETLLKLPPLEFTSYVEMKEEIPRTDNSNEEIETGDLLKFERIRQRSDLVLDEKGARIRTVTSYESELESTFEMPEEICFDHPFIFAIVDSINGVVLYSGAVRNPVVK